jgi:mannose-1-phosphate guanylyltransferase/phosphomannomutase
MARSGADRPKPLMEVAGRSLLEWNVRSLVRHGLRDIHVAIAAGAHDLAGHIDATCRPLVEAAGGTVAVVAEDEPLGSIGAAALVPAGVDRVLVVNADNLTALDLSDLLEVDARKRPALTVAVHVEPFHMPFGEVTVEGDRLESYVEKPTYEIQISSAVTVVGRAAIDLIEPGHHAMLPGLVQRALDAGLAVGAYQHAAPWIDVNDLDARRRAEDLVAAHPDLFPRSTR